MFKIIFCIAAYIVLMFAFFFVANLIYDFTEDERFTTALLAFVWPISTVAWIFYVLFRCTYELASDIKIRVRIWRRRDSE